MSTTIVAIVDNCVDVKIDNRLLLTGRRLVQVQQLIGYVGSLSAAVLSLALVS